MNNCTTTNLNPYNGIWDKKRIQHFAKRIGFGLSHSELQFALQQNPQTYIQSKLNELSNIPFTTFEGQEDPFYAEWSDYYWDCYDYQNGYASYNSVANDDPSQCNALGNLYDQHNPSGGNSKYTSGRIIAALYDSTWFENMFIYGLKYKMNLFWTNHFVVESFTVGLTPQAIHEYYNTITTFAFGNFKDFVKAIGKTTAMLKYLSGSKNTNTNLNENYARELYELFTLGVDNGYTQNDIVETAKAFTGWTFDIHRYPMTGYFNHWDHVPETKTIFGQTVNRSQDDWALEYDDVIDILFEQRANEIAEFICTEIYKFFVSYDVDTNIIAGLKNTFLNNNTKFEILPVLAQLFKSEHFFDEHNIGSKIKSPADTLLNFAKEINIDLETIPDRTNINLNLTTITSEVSYWLPVTNREIQWKHILLCGMSQMGQCLFQPPNVAGWLGDKSWLNAKSTTTFWDLIDNYVQIVLDTNAGLLRDFAETVSNNSSDPKQITTAIINHFIPNGLRNDNPNCEVYECYTDVFTGASTYGLNPSWTLNHPDSPLQIAALLKSIIRLPEFQLF